MECIYCERNADEVPLLALRFQGNDFWICPQHLPILIHKPRVLAEKLPGLGDLSDADSEIHPH